MPQQKKGLISFNDIAKEAFAMQPLEQAAPLKKIATALFIVISKKTAKANKPEQISMCAFFGIRLLSERQNNAK